jgi:hypothetical protein
MDIRMSSRIRAGAVAVAILFVLRLNLEAQAAPPASQENVTQVSFPDSRAEWTVTISTSGGFDGRGQGGFNLTSAGGFTCISATPCSRQIQKPALQSIEGFINSATLPQPLQMTGLLLPMSVQARPSVCMDCIETTMSLRIRDSKGGDWFYAWSWDVTTQSSVPADLMRIFRAAAELAKS